MFSLSSSFSTMKIPFAATFQIKVSFRFLPRFAFLFPFTFWEPKVPFESNIKGLWSESLVEPGNPVFQLQSLRCLNWLNSKWLASLTELKALGTFWPETLCSPSIMFSATVTRLFPHSPEEVCQKILHIKNAYIHLKGRKHTFQIKADPRIATKPPQWKKEINISCKCL